MLKAEPLQVFSAGTEAPLPGGLSEPCGMGLGVLGEPHPLQLEALFGKRVGIVFREPLKNSLGAAISSSSADVNHYLCFLLKKPWNG